MEKVRVKQTVKASLLWDAEKHVFHAFECLPGEAHEVNTLKELVDSVQITIRKLFADGGFSSRENVQYLADNGIIPVIRPQEGATSRSKGHPAWRKHVREYRKLGYERWRVETGYATRFQEEHTIGALVNRFGDEVRSRSVRVASKSLGARISLHNFFAFLFSAAKAQAPAV